MRVKDDLITKLYPFVGIVPTLDNLNIHVGVKTEKSNLVEIKPF